MSLKDELTKMVDLARSLGRDVPPVIEELFIAIGHAFDGTKPEDVPAAAFEGTPVAEAPPVVEPVAPVADPVAEATVAPVEPTVEAAPVVEPVSPVDAPIQTEAQPEPPAVPMDKPV
jgi:hypothetical protein